MSDHAHESHGHASPDHVPHITPLWVYLATWGTLVVLTAVTVGISYPSKEYGKTRTLRRVEELLRGLELTQPEETAGTAE